MKLQFYNRILSASVLVMLVITASAHAGPIRIAFHDTTVTAGTQFDYPVYIDSSMTGLGVISYQASITFNNTVFTFLGARTDSTMSAGWSIDTNKIVSASTTTLNIAGADTGALKGTGKLIILRFLAPLIYQYNSYGYVTLQSVLFNQGSPLTTLVNKTISITALPLITVSPDTWLMTKGDTKQFNISGGHAPYTWTSTNPSVASITSGGLITALSAGFTRIVCVDSSGLRDTSGNVEVRALMLSIHDTSCYQGQSVVMPVYATNSTGLGIISGQFTISYNSTLWTPDSLLTTGTMLDGWSATFGTPTQNQANIVFSSGTSQLSGAGVLLRIRMKATKTTYGGSTVGFMNPLFNESILSNVTSGNLTVVQLVPLTIAPGGVHTLVAGDSLQFTASNGTAPYAWTVSDTSRASVSSLGWVKAKKSGTVTATAQDVNGSTGTSGAINIYDFRLSVPDSSLVPSDTLDFPLYVTSNNIGFTSVQMTVTYSTGSYVRLIDVVSAGTLISGWSLDKLLSTGSANIAASGISNVKNGGMLLKLRFAIPDSTPRPSTVNITLSNVVFNQGVPAPLIDYGYFSITSSAVFGITPSSGTIHTMSVGQKDSTIFTVHNTGTATLTSSINIVGSGEFTLSTYNISVPPSDSVKIKAYYQSINAGGDTATIHFSTNDPYHASVNVTLIGLVQQFAVFDITPTSGTIHSAAIGQKDSMIFTVHNTGVATLTSSISIIGSSEFTLSTSNISVAPLDSVKITAYYLPTNAGSDTATIHFSTNDPNHTTVDVPLIGIVQQFAVFSIMPASGTIHSLTVGQKDSVIFTVHNTGTATLTSTVGIIGSAEFTLSTSNISVAPLDSVKITAYYLPTNTGSDTASIHFATNDPSHLTVNVTLIGIVQQFPVLGVAPMTIDFGSVKTGQFTDTTISITNSGTDSLKISNIAANNGVFTSLHSVITIAPGGSFVDTLRFSPIAITVYNGWFLITSNASSSPDTIKVSGTGESSSGVRNDENVPETFTLNQNYPNPFNPTTTISFTIQVSGFTTLKVYNILGNEVATLIAKDLEKGMYHEVTFDASQLPSGIYFARLESNGNKAMMKMLLLK